MCCGMETGHRPGQRIRLVFVAQLLLCNGRILQIARLDQVEELICVKWERTLESRGVEDKTTHVGKERMGRAPSGKSGLAEFLQEKPG